jgi:hypothetical protein
MQLAPRLVHIELLVRAAVSSGDLLTPRARILHLHEQEGARREHGLDAETCPQKCEHVAGVDRGRLLRFGADADLTQHTDVARLCEHRQRRCCHE